MFGWIEIYSSLHYEKAEERQLLLEGKGFRCKMKIKTGARFSPGGETETCGYVSGQIHYSQHSL